MMQGNIFYLYINYLFIDLLFLTCNENQKLIRNEYSLFIYFRKEMFNTFVLFFWSFKINLSFQILNLRFELSSFFSTYLQL